MNYKMALLDSSKLLCLVCNTNIDLNSCTNIFYVSLPHNGEILVNFVLKVLKLSTSDLSSSYVCIECYNLFGMLEQAQWTAANIQTEIFKIYQNNSNTKLYTNNSMDIVPKARENYLEIEKHDQTHDSKIIISEHLSEKDFNSLNNITNQISQDSVISNEIEIQYGNKTRVINNEEKTKIINSTSIEERLESDTISIESYNTKPLNLFDNTSIFSNKIIKIYDTKDKNKFKSQNIENISNFQNDADDNKGSNSVKNVDNPKMNPNHNPKSWKFGRISKYSQKLLKHTCLTCNKKWRTSTELKIHMKSHSNLRPYMCEKCGQAYKHKHALEIHVGMHNGVSPFRCSYCDKCFTQKGALQRHLPMHTGEMPYQCELCGKRFVHHTSYNMHALSHTGKKSYRCHVCDLSLLSTSHLKRHMRVHSGEKPYTCSFCSKSFAERYNLLAHQKVHDPMQISIKEIKRNHYKCNQCDVVFSKKQQFTEHMNRHSVDKKTGLKLGYNIDFDPSKMKSTQSKNHDVNAADLLESCVNEVWQSLSKSGDRLTIVDSSASVHDKQSRLFTDNLSVPDVTKIYDSV